MLKRSLLVLAVLIAAFASAPVAHAQEDASEDEGLLLRINGDVEVASDDRISAVTVIHGDIVVNGIIDGFLLVINGDARVTDGGRVDGDITMIRGDLTLDAGSTVENVSLINSDINRDPGATVTGEIDEESDLNWGLIWGVFGVWLWVSLTVALILTGLIFAAIGGLQLQRSAVALTADVAYSILGAVIVWIALPIVAAIALVTIVAIPFGLGLLLIVLPAMWFLGYIVAGTRIGLAVVGRMNREPGHHPYLAVFLGILILQIIALIPIIGWVIAIVAGLYGAGGLALTAWRGFRPPPEPSAAAPTPEAA